VQENDIVILSTDGMTDNLWDEDVIQQVIRFTSTVPLSPSVPSTLPKKQPLSSIRTALLPITLSHALCTKARSVAENGPPITDGEPPEIPFGRRAKEAGHSFVGGKQDGKLRVDFPFHPNLVIIGHAPSLVLGGEGVSTRCAFSQPPALSLVG
jgi:protein phosphatase PTC7